MTRALENRLAKIETLRARARPFFVEVPQDAWDRGDAHLERMSAEAIRQHQARTGYYGPLLLGPLPCTTEVEWVTRYGSPAAIVLG